MTKITSELVAVNLTNASLKRCTEHMLAPDDYAEIFTLIKIRTEVKSLDEAKLYGTIVCLGIELKDAEKNSLLEVIVFYEASFACGGGTEAEIITYLEHHAAYLLGEQLNSVCADLITQAGLPAFVLQPEELKTQPQSPAVWQSPRGTVQ